MWARAHAAADATGTRTDIRERGGLKRDNSAQRASTDGAARIAAPCWTAAGGDGGDSDGDASLGPKRVFVTETRYTRDLRGELGAASGAEAADAACRAAAGDTTGPAVRIDITEYGVAPTIGAAGVWTGTRFDGTAGRNCGEWARGDTGLGSAGRRDVTGSDWTDVGWPVLAGNTCDSLNRIYCFEQ